VADVFGDRVIAGVRARFHRAAHRAGLPAVVGSRSAPADGAPEPLACQPGAGCRAADAAAGRAVLACQAPCRSCEPAIAARAGALTGLSARAGRVSTATSSWPRTFSWACSAGIAPAACARGRIGLVDSALAVLRRWRRIASVLAQSGRVLAARRRTQASERDPACTVGQVVPDAAVPRRRVGGIGRATVDPPVNREREVAGV
jgi:hypothetical protein